MNSLEIIYFLFFFHINFCCLHRLKELRVGRLYNIPGGIYLLQVNSRNTRTRCEIYSKLTIKTPEQRQWRRSGVFIVNFDHFFTPCSCAFIVNFEHAIAYTNSDVFRTLSNIYDEAFLRKQFRAFSRSNRVLIAQLRIQCAHNF